MRTSWLYCLTTVALLVANFNTVFANRQAILPRQDTPTPTENAVTTSASSSRTSKSDTAAQTSESTKSASSASISASAQSSGKSSSSEAAATSSNSTSATLEPSATPISNSSFTGNITNIPDIQGLPVHPEVTPALAVAGALLILTGGIYTLIGIKTKWLHIFCSTAYLFSLCVVVLIVYVMHPPISNAIQGAYFIAAAMTGIIFGAIAVVFADVTEGLGCFLGGFCLGMWFLCLKPDGLITSQAGKSIFLGCFTVGAFALYISHYTRPYGLIGSTSFAGATAVLLGVDMFGRAGLKEFWLYIWDLNDGLFPLHYQGPYPITRGMRVEIACIVLLCLMGVMSQMKVWNIIKERREQKVVEQRRRDEMQNQAEEELGRRIEEDNDRDRVVWDAVYGKKGKGQGSQTDSGIGTSQASTRKGSMSMAEAGGMEMQTLASASSSIRKGIVTVHVAQDDDTALPSPVETPSIRSNLATPREPSIHESQIGGARSAISETESIRPPKKAFIDPKLTLKPKFVPLPFKVPNEATASDEDDKSSVATFAASEHGVERPASRSKKISGSSLVRKLSGRSKRLSVIPTTSEEALVIPHYDDRASSVAGTLDGISLDDISHEKLASGSQSPMSTGTKSPSTDFGTPDILPSPRQEDIGVATSGPIHNQEADVARSPTNGQFDEALEHKARGIMTDSLEPEPKGVRASFAGNLPGGASKVVMAYRTNEWAKHLDNAEAPVVQDVKLIKPHKAPIGEATAPVNMKELQQTALTAEPAPATSTGTQLVDEKAQVPSPKPTSKSSSPRISPSASNTNLVKSVPRSPSQTSLNSTHSNEGSRPLPRTRASSSSLTRGLRSSSTPMVSSPLAEPIDEDAESSFPARFAPSPMHLMSQRESTIQSRPSSTSLLNRNSNGLQRTVSANSSSLALANIHENGPADDDIPLAQRKSILQQSLSQSTLLPPHRSPSTSPYGTPLNLSRNPSRLSLAPKQSATLLHPNNIPQTDSTISAWRSSLANDSSHQNAREAAEIEQRRIAMMQEKQAARNSKVVERMQEQARRSVLDKEMMRRGSGMMDAHREAMRKMQGSVNEKLKNGNGGETAG